MALTIVAGNVTVAPGSINASYILELCGAHVLVFVKTANGNVCFTIDQARWKRSLMRSLNR